MIIVEGADLVGKSTLARALADVTGLRYQHQDKPSPGYNYLTHGLPEVLKHHGEVVQDRFHLGEIVYGSVLGDGAGRTTTLAEMSSLQNELLRLCVPTVVVYFSDGDMFEEHVRNQFDEERELYDVDTILWANAAYRILAENKRMHIKWDVSELGWPIVENILTMCTIWKQGPIPARVGWDFP